MGSIILAIPNEKNSQRICEILARHDYAPDAVCTLGAQVLRAAGSMDYGIVVCARKLRDMSYREVYEYLPEHFHLLLLSPDSDNHISGDGLMRLTIPFKPSDLVNTIDMMMSSLDSIVKINRKPSRSVEDKKKIDKAKLLLMDRNDMTEPEAFRYIQKTSMDTGRTMLETAEMILLLNWDRS
ncbi:MAG: ANTAR domain-containing protein [Lachnospiraceae bacterium]|nr:ANTAR domain-containing protein [Lachnospiraceae bacterium]